MSSSTRGGASGAARRGGKFAKPKRGGGKHFSRDLQPVNADGEQISMWADPQDKVEEESSEEEEEESSGEDDQPQPDQEQTREQRKAAAKARKEAAIAKQKAHHAEPGDLPPSSDSEEEDDAPANPNRASKAKDDGEQLSRREREAVAAQQAKERYQALHLAGKTDEAKADLERLKLIRQQREEAAARKKAEAEEKAERDKVRAEQMTEREKKLREAAMGGGSKKGGKPGKKK